MTPEGRALRLAAIKDAAIVGAQMTLCRQTITLALATLNTGLSEIAADDYGDNPAPMPLHESAAHARQALNELEALRRTLRDHFDQLGAPPSLELNRP